MATAANATTHAAQAIPPLMDIPLILIGAALLAYLIGSIPFGVILSKLFNVGDLRQVGSGNIGATNMLRAGGKKLGMATLVLDMAKGALAVLVCGAVAKSLLASKLTADSGIGFDMEKLYYFFGLYAVIGHVWPVWLNFKGGKGVATALGVLLAAVPLVGILALVCWLMTFLITRYSSLSALISIGIAPFACTAVGNRSAAIASLCIALIIFWRHRENIARLIARTEPKVKLKKE